MLIWYRDGIEIAPRADTMLYDKYVQSEITIGPIAREDLNSRLSCKAINHPRATPVESVVQIDMNCRTIFFVIVIIKC